jgi:2-hydroxy-6-oxonona-2,4-dienedioate hydrolase
VDRLILVHGLGVSPRYFAPLLEEVPTAEAPDLRPAVELSALAERLAAVVGERPAALLGNSFGCQVIAELAVRRPELVARVVFVGPTVDRRRRSWVSQAARLALDAIREPPRLVALAVRDYLSTGPLRTLRMAREALRDPLELKLPALRAPLIVVRGARDPLCPQDWAEEVVRVAPCGRLVVVPGAAHAVHYSHSRELAGIVRAFREEPQ